MSVHVEDVVHHGRPYRAHILEWEETVVTAYEPVAPGSMGHADAVVMIHGLADSWDVWEGIAWELAPWRRVFCLELPWGARNYTREPGPSPSVWLHRILRWLPVLKFDIVAHSFGADTALSYLDRYGAGRLDRAVFVSPFFQSSVEAFNWSTLTYFVDHFAELLRTGLVARDRAYAHGEVAHAMAEHVRDRLGPEGWLQFFSLFAGTPHLHLSKVKVPVLVVGGGRDTASLPKYATDLAAAFTDGRADVMAECGHFPMLDDPDGFTARVMEFFAFIDEETDDYPSSVSRHVS